MLNKVQLIGRLGADPETTYTTGGQSVCNVSLATDYSYKNKNGERVKNTTWHKLVLWGKTADFAKLWTQKGGRVYVEGRIETREYDDKEGIRRWVTEIRVHEYSPIDWRDESREKTSTTDAQQEADFGNDELPF